MSDEAGFRVLWSRTDWTPTMTTVLGAGRVDTAGNVRNVGDWFTLPGSGIGFDAVYGSGPELLLLFSALTDTALGGYYGNYRLWGRFGDVPGIEQAESRQPRRVAGGASVVSGILWLPQASSRKPQTASLLDVSGRKVLDLHSGANDVRALAFGVYFVRGEERGTGDEARIRKVVITR